MAKSMAAFEKVTKHHCLRNEDIYAMKRHESDLASAWIERYLAGYRELTVHCLNK
jgi:hypothetical protein